MSDLVARLRNPPFADRINTVSLHNEAADRIEQLEAALRFYGEQWDQDVDAELTANGWEGSIGEMQPTQELLSDAGDKARSLLSQSAQVDGGVS